MRLTILLSASSAAAFAAFRADAANPIRIGKTLAALAALATFCTPATSAESQRYTVTVLEQIRSEITVEANEEYAARAMALLEARRISRFGSPVWSLRRQPWSRMRANPKTLPR
jgi:hypothetical protein